MNKAFIRIGILAVIIMLFASIVGCSHKVNKEQQNKEIIIGLDDTFVPMGFLDENGKLVGFDVDLAKEAFKRMNKEIKFQTIDWSMKETEINSGNIDVIWNGYTLNDERKNKVSYTDSYMKNKLIIVAMSESGINTKSDLEGKVVATQQSSSPADVIEKDTKLKSSFKGGAPVLYDTYDKALRDMEIGRTDAIVGDEVLIRYYMKQKGEEKYKILEEDLGYQNFVVATAKDNEALSKEINDTLNEMKKDGSFNKIYSKWLSDIKK